MSNTPSRDLYAILSIFVAIMTRCDMSKELVPQLTALNKEGFWDPDDIQIVAAKVTAASGPYPHDTPWHRVSDKYRYPIGCPETEALRTLANAGTPAASTAAAQAGGR